METSNYHIARLDQYNISDLSRLYEAVYHVPPTSGYFERKYDTTFAGVRYAGYLAYNEDARPVAYYGVIPCFVRCQNRIILAAQSGDTMTDPAFRFKGMFVELSRITFDLCKTLGINFAFGFPNQHSYHGAITKLGWQMTERMDCFAIKIPTIPFARYSNKSMLSRKIYREYSEWIIDKYRSNEAGVFNSVLDKGFDGLHRDEAYLEYKRYGSTIVVSAGKAKAWIKCGTSMIVGDLDLGEQDFMTTIKALKKLAWKLGMSELLFHSSPGTRLHQLFLAHYKPIESFPVLFQDLGAPVDFKRFKFTFADIDTF